MIIGTVVLNVIAMIVIFVLEYNNVKTLGNLSLNENYGLPSFKVLLRGQLDLIRLTMEVWKNHLYYLR